MKVSILTVAYNSAATLRQTIESVLAQDYTSIEYWVIDGGSTDDSFAILQSFGSKINFISEPDAGIYDALNKGLARLTGDVVGVIGADDFYPHAQVISTVVAGFHTHQTDAIYGDLQFVHPTSLAVVRYWKAGAYRVNNWLWGWMPPHLAFYVKRKVYEDLGYYHTDFTCAADYEWMLRALFKHKISAAYLPALLMTMRTGGTSTASWKHRWVANREDRRAWAMNGLSPYPFTVTLKPLRKIIQLLKR